MLGRPDGIGESVSEYDAASGQLLRRLALPGTSPRYAVADARNAYVASGGETDFSHDRSTCW